MNVMFNSMHSSSYPPAFSIILTYMFFLYSSKNYNNENMLDTKPYKHFNLLLFEKKSFTCNYYVFFYKNSFCLLCK